MKIRSSAELGDALDRSFAWRRKELHVLRTETKTASGPMQSLLVRAGVALLYAHWEGFTRESLRCYLAFLRHRKPKYSEISDALFFAAITTEMKRRRMDETPQELGSALRQCAELRAKLPGDDAIDTGGNLNYQRTVALLELMGLQVPGLELKANFMDSELLRGRNRIAHGEYASPSAKDYPVLHDQVVEMMSLVRTAIENEAQLIVATL